MPGAISIDSETRYCFSLDLFIDGTRTSGPPLEVRRAVCPSSIRNAYRRSGLYASLHPACLRRRQARLLAHWRRRKPARKHFVEVEEKPILAHTGSQRTAHSAAHLRNCLTANSQDFLSEIPGPPTVQPGQTSTDYGNVREEFQTRV